MPSAVWLHFVKFTGKDGIMVRCKQCKKEMKFTGSTTNMILHLKGIHNVELTTLPAKGGKQKRTFEVLSLQSPEIDADDPEPVAATTDEEVFSPTSAKVAQRRFSQGPLEACISNVNAFAPGGTRDAQCLNALLYMICKDTMPLSTPNRSGFKLFSRTLQPLFKIPSKTAVVNLLEEKYNSLRARVSSVLEKAEYITLTADLWSQKSTMRSYLGVTAHIVIESDLVPFELVAVPMEERKTQENLQKALRTVCANWKIDKEKVRIFVTDGGANIKAAVKAEFGPNKHVSCLAHVNNLIGQTVIGNTKYNVPSEMEHPNADLDLPENESDLEVDDDDDAISEEESGTIKELIVKVKRIVRFFRQSEIATTRLLAAQRQAIAITKALAEEQSRRQEQSETHQNGNENSGNPQNTMPHPPQQPLKLIQEVVTRWNSCYEMIDRYLTLAVHVTPVLYDIKRDRSSKSNPPDVLSPNEEEVLREVRDLLAPLAQMTKELSTEKTTTLSKCIPVVRSLRTETGKCNPKSAIGKTLKADILKQINERLGSIENVPLYAVATLCFPRFKRFGFYKDLSTPVRVSKAVTALVTVKMREARAQSAATEALQMENNGDNGDEDGFWGDFDREAETLSIRHSGQDIAGGIPVQLRMYLDTNVVSRKSTPNPLVPWEALKGEYKYVYQVAREYLSILATSVPSERLFSHAGLIASQLRTRLSGDHIDMLFFLRSCPDKYWF